MISFSKPYIPKNALGYIEEVFKSGLLSGDHNFTRKCHHFLESKMSAEKVLLTTSGTHALEMSALLAGIKAGDEVICPSFTFSSSANAFALRGARLRFVDVDAITMNITAEKIEQAITPRTRAVCIVHYAGVACEMDSIMDICRAKNIIVIEDAAQAIGAEYKGKALGTIGTYGCLSFHETKNITCGEGGAFVCNNPESNLRAEILREKGTNRAQFFRGEIDKYSWRDVGSSYLPSDINAAFLMAQFEELEFIQAERLRAWNRYAENLKNLALKNYIEVPQIPEYAKKHNGHIFFLKLNDISERSAFIKFMHAGGVQCTFHYVPLHSSEAGQKWGDFVGSDQATTKESERLVRLPLYTELSNDTCDFVSEKIEEFFRRKTI